ncbi:hypothetical protein CPB83DRAFT_860097 [Crepidotus variabilis]|uniref:Uncharacterized protein n=1 Tax=Crepidotus variabilis TaxID=179855 RepID=A0A9P6E9V7_9AGAR|nr:hypothetical protein CPB83DRAFT_860097 [Crepidotus variabilis]
MVPILITRSVKCNVYLTVLNSLEACFTFLVSGYIAVAIPFMTSHPTEIPTLMVGNLIFCLNFHKRYQLARKHVKLV